MLALSTAILVEQNGEVLFIEVLFIGGDTWVIVQMVDLRSADHLTEQVFNSKPAIVSPFSRQ